MMISKTNLRQEVAANVYDESNCNEITTLLQPYSAVSETVTFHDTKEDFDFLIFENANDEQILAEANIPIFMMPHLNDIISCNAMPYSKLVDGQNCRHRHEPIVFNTTLLCGSLDCYETTNQPTAFFSSDFEPSDDFSLFSDDLETTFHETSTITNQCFPSLFEIIPFEPLLPPSSLKDFVDNDINDINDINLFPSVEIPTSIQKIF
ncbi:hypothetical protein G9A89_011517 [Geosiphon pyriformis]|nr:hypothetical protein G9A89_011517 [Geosiphon pyriformis]